MNAQGHSRSPAAVSGQVAYRCAVYCLIILYVKREAVIASIDEAVGWNFDVAPLLCIHLIWCGAMWRLAELFSPEKKSFLLKAKRFRAAVPFSSPLSTVSRNWFATPTAAAAAALFSSLSLVTRCSILSNRLHVTFPESLKWPLSIPAVICTYTRPPQLENDPVIKCTALLRLPTLNVIYSIHVYTADSPY